MNKNKFLLLISMVLYVNLHAQIVPSQDSNFQINSSLSDEFDSLDLSKWKICDLWDGDCANWGGNSRFVSSNTIVYNGELSLKVDAPFSNPPYSFQTCCNTGGIHSLDSNYHYGYYEICAKLPGNYHNGESNGQKFFPAFWTYNQESIEQYIYIHDEIDILEPSGHQYSDGKTNVCGWHDENGNGGHYKVGEDSIKSDTPLFENYHKYGVEWNTDRIIFYFDDIPFYCTYNHPSLIMRQQYVVIDLQIDESVYDFNPSITFPQYMKVLYFKYYELKIDSCMQNAFILNNSDLNNFSFGIRQNIIIGNGSSSISLPTGSIKTFRASNEIIINGDFTVYEGSELNLIPTPCN